VDGAPPRQQQRGQMPSDESRGSGQEIVRHPPLPRLDVLVRSG
jgi:hypothetical protein